jgi:hypothetical protein
MKERPILFSAPMVRAILDGRKTMTRRLVKGAPPAAGCARWVIPQGKEHKGWAGALFFQGGTPESRGLTDIRCPYGVPDDLLWVRETWAADAPLDQVRAAYEDVMSGSFGASIYYRADGAHEGTGLEWKPSIHMFRWMSRITLRITSIRVERVQDISDDDALREGTQGKRSFAALWDSINAKRGYGWESNPWVWVVSFERV